MVNLGGRKLEQVEQTHQEVGGNLCWVCCGNHVQGQQMPPGAAVPARRVCETTIRPKLRKAWVGKATFLPSAGQDSSTALLIPKELPAPPAGQGEVAA